MIFLFEPSSTGLNKERLALVSGGEGNSPFFSATNMKSSMDFVSSFSSSLSLIFDDLFFGPLMNFVIFALPFPWVLVSVVKLGRQRGHRGTRGRRE